MMLDLSFTFQASRSLLSGERNFLFTFTLAYAQLRSTNAGVLGVVLSSSFSAAGVAQSVMQPLTGISVSSSRLRPSALLLTT
jgi:hypothetical protein